MSPTRPCTSCGSQLESADKFCPSCGREASSPATPLSTKTCSFCGHTHSADVTTCVSCGARIGAVQPAIKPATAQTPRVSSAPSFFQSWKFTAGIGMILAAGLIILVMTGDEPEPVAAQPDPHDTGMMQEIRELQSRIDANPGDQEALLHLANRLYDVQFFDRAATMYERYLELNPQNLDARVDLGTSYFQMSFSDTLKHETYQLMAETAFLDAIKSNPEHQLANFNLGIIQLHKGDMGGAREWFQKCIAIDPNTESARRAKELLSQHVQNNPS